MSTVVCDDDAKINLLLDKAPSCLKRLVHFRELKRETIARAKKQGMELFRFEEIERIGSANSHIHREKVRSETRGVYGSYSRTLRDHKSKTSNANDDNYDGNDCVASKTRRYLHRLLHIWHNR
jgi:hypothetical protein